MTTLPAQIKHINTDATFKPLSMNLGGKIKARCTAPGTMNIKKGKLIELDINDLGSKFLTN